MLEITKYPKEGTICCPLLNRHWFSFSISDFPPISHSISVGEASNRVTVITAGDNARFDIHHDNGLPDNSNKTNPELVFAAP